MSNWQFILTLRSWDLVKATDHRRADLSEVFFVGQSVRSNILDVSRNWDFVFQ